MTRFFLDGGGGGGLAAALLGGHVGLYGGGCRLRWCPGASTLAACRRLAAKRSRLGLRSRRRPGNAGATATTTAAVRGMLLLRRRRLPGLHLPRALGRDLAFAALLRGELGLALLVGQQRLAGVLGEVLVRAAGLAEARRAHRRGEEAC